MPRRLTDYVPHGDMSLAHVPPRAPTPPERDDRSTSPDPIENHSPDPQPHPFQTHTNKLGVFRRYTHAPTWYPRHEERLDLVCDSRTSDIQPHSTRTETIHELSRDTPNPYAPFPNFTTAAFMATYFSGMDSKSEEHATSLAKITQDPRYKAEDLAGFNSHVENTRLDKYLKDGTQLFQTKDGWQESTVHIRLPVEKKPFSSEDDAPTLPIHRLFHRRITDIVKTVCESKAADTFHFPPYTMHWCPDSLDPGKHERIYADTYASDAMIQAQTDVDSIPRQEGDIKERIALGLMLASDSAQLTSFGSASVWPIYLMFANQSKQERVRPTCHAVHHLAYVPSVSPLVSIESHITLTSAQLGGDFASRYQTTTAQAPTAAVEVHCKRELMHAVWDLLLDEEFVDAYTNGLVIRCTDGIERVFFLRIISYSADYPEKQVPLCQSSSRDADVR